MFKSKPLQLAEYSVSNTYYSTIIFMSIIIITIINERYRICF